MSPLPASWISAISTAHGLNHSIAQVICSSHQFAFTRARSPSEVDFVAALTQYAPGALASLVRPLVSGSHAVHIWSLFLHQSPKAEFVDSTSMTVNCELADLGLAIRVPNTRGGWDGHGALIQTKIKASPRSSHLSTVHGAQFDLYDRWPTFDLKSLGCSGFALGSLAEQGLVGIIDGARCASSPSMASTSCAGCVTAGPLWELEDFRSPATILALNDVWLAMLAGGFGREFSIPAAGSPSANDWDRIWALLLSSAVTGKTFKLASSGISGDPRGVVACAMQFSNDKWLPCSAVDGCFLIPPNIETWPYVPSGPHSPIDFRANGFGEQGLGLIIVDVLPNSV